jgi:hypothetical protein
MFRHAMGDETDGGVAYDEDGFIRAMVAAGWTGEGWRIQLHPNDHDPPHVHFWLKGDQRAQVRLSLATGEPLDGEALPTGSKKRLAKASQFVVANQPLLMSKWTEAHPIVGSSQPLGPDSDPT